MCYLQFKCASCSHLNCKTGFQLENAHGSSTLNWSSVGPLMSQESSCCCHHPYESLVNNNWVMGKVLIFLYCNAIKHSPFMMRTASSTFTALTTLSTFRFLTRFYFYFYDMFVWVWLVNAGPVWKPEEGIRHPGAGVRGDCESADVGAGNWA